ncbi:hypothetical protein ACFYPA_36675 [Streptomyces sp. NPDC005775]|uniref:hypothetical protein n=1 Tax=Streptomyces sp. NPDC005775 TaxID=3364729 RepID=UPI0036A932DA
MTDRTTPQTPPLLVITGRLPRGEPMRADRRPDRTTITWDDQQVTAEEIAAAVLAVRQGRAARTTG